MTLTFISHQWKAFLRSHNTVKSIAIRIVLGLFILYLLIILLIASFFLDIILFKTFPGRDVISSFNGLLLYYFLLDLITRYQLQELPTLSVQPYLHLPVRRRQIINYLSFISLFSAFNLAPFILTMPFLVKVVKTQYGGVVFISMITAIAGLTLFNHFFSLWLKRKINLNAWFLLGFLILIAVIASLDLYWHFISISTFSAGIFTAIRVQPLYSGLVLIFGVGMYIINYRFLRKNLYLDELHANKSGIKSSTEIPFLNRFGIAGDLAATELKLILRNKRPRSTVLMSGVFMFYGLMFYRNPAGNDFGGLLIGYSMFMTGIFILNYGQFMFSWQSSHFDGILANRISSLDFFKSKFLLFTLFSTLTFLLTIPYVYFGWKILIMQFVMYLWNLGVNTVIILYFANWNYKRIDLSKRASFNWEGVGASQFILGLPIMLSPFIIYFPMKWLGNPVLGIIVIGVTGLICILTRRFWINRLAYNFKQRRYHIAEGFRNN